MFAANGHYWNECLEPPHFAAVGEFYEDFREVTDEQAIAFLKKANARVGNALN